MASGGRGDGTGQEWHPGPRSRTSLVIDELLARDVADDASAPAVTAQHGAEPVAKTSIGDVLRRTTTTVLEMHLTWLVGRTQRNDHRSSQRILLQDQARILIAALDERGESEAIARALERPWIAVDVRDHDGIGAYASDLMLATSGEPGYSPYVLLAHSAAKVAADVLDGRGSSTPRHSPT